MSEQLSNRYKPLFEIRLLHHYWLDEGGIVFDQLKSKEDTKGKNEEKRNERLRLYDCGRFFIVEPTAGTAKILSGLGCVYKTTSLGCIVATPNNVKIPKKTKLEFAVTVRDPDLFNYTALTLRPQTIHEIYHEVEKKTYRYKKNIFVLSNRNGTERNINSNGNTLFLSTEFSNTADGVESFFIENNGALKQLTGDQPDSAQVLGNKDDNPVYVHQEDIPVITPPATFPEELAKQVPERGIQLSKERPDDIFALIQLQARLSNEKFSLVDMNGQAKDDHPVYDIRFKNRSTLWKYINKKTGAFSSMESDPLPLTYYGNAGSQQKPANGQFIKIEEGNYLVSEFFI
ncbi:MAG: hypothetical protein D3913_06455 [Candidatus Electrothrix sp. LOE1_4_5]|nr:hypothetical protein [Candidatus Electrothrix gigas]